MSRIVNFLHQRSELQKKSWSLVLIFILAAITGTSRGHTILEEYSCGQGDIEYQVTLKGGTNAGLFHRHGEVKNIHECIHKCCESKRCDVAMMEGKQCFGVQCLNETLCESVPVSPGATDSFQISHVSSKGLDFTKNEKALQPTSLHDDNLKAREGRCPFNGIMYNVKLKGGLKAGRFTDVGKVKSLNTCIRYCCDSKVPCDLSFMLDDRCYLVKCYSEERCEAMPANTHDFQFKQRMAFVSPWLFKRNKKIMKVPSGLNKHHLKCVQTKVHTNTDLVGGPYAGDFKDMGKVGKPHRCTRMCCEDHECDVAYMVGENCFLVKCYSDDLCKLKKHNATLSGDAKSSRSVQFIVKRDFDVTMDNDGKVKERHPDHRKCSMDGEIHNDTELLLGMLSGKLTAHMKVKEMNDCFGKCCDDKSCHVALMNDGMCYSVHCDQPQLCQTKPASQAAKRKNPKVAFVMRGEDTIYVAPPPPPPPPPPTENITVASNETESLNKTTSLNETVQFNSTSLMDYYIQHYNMSHNATTAWFDKGSNNSMAGLYFYNNTWSYDPFWNITITNVTLNDMSGSGSGMMSGSGSGMSDESEGEDDEDDDEPPLEIVDEDEEAQIQADAKAKAAAKASASGSGAQESSATGQEVDAGEGDISSGNDGSGTSSVSGESEAGSGLQLSDVQPFVIPPEQEVSGSGMNHDEVSGNEASGNEASGNEAIGNEASGNEASGNEASGNEESGSSSDEKETGSGIGDDKPASENSGDVNGDNNDVKKEETNSNDAQSDSTEATASETLELDGLLTPVDEQPAEPSKKVETNEGSASASEAKHIEEETKMKTMLENEASGEGSGEQSKNDDEQQAMKEDSGSAENSSNGEEKQAKSVISSAEEKQADSVSSGEDKQVSDVSSSGEEKQADSVNSGEEKQADSVNSGEDKQTSDVSNSGEDKQADSVNSGEDKQTSDVSNSGEEKQADSVVISGEPASLLEALQSISTPKSDSATEASGESNDGSSTPAK